MTTDRATLVRRASAAVFVVFFLSGFNFASWASRMPAIRDGLGYSPDKMGLLLLVGSVGSLVGLPLAGIAVERLGTKKAVFVFAAMNTVGLALGGIGVGLDQVLVVALGMVIYGFGTGIWDAAMNVEGAAVEQRLGRTVMPRYHAGFSFGTVAAAGVAALAAGLEIPVAVHIPIAVGLSLVAVGFAVRVFLVETSGPHHGHHAPAAAAGEVDVTAAPAAVHDAPRGARGALAAWREPRTLLIGLVVLAAALTEGAANDWLSLAVVDGFGVGHAVGALVFGLFVAAMTTMRWFGTGLLDRFGRVAVLRLCAGLALVGLLTFGLSSTLWVALLGTVMWGTGAALGFPVGMSAASDDPLRAAARVAVVSTIGYSAFLAGPPLLGLLAQHVGYRHALLAIAIPVLLGLLVVGAAAPLRVHEPEDETAAVGSRSTGADEA
jgi:MFS family permease